MRDTFVLSERKNTGVKTDELFHYKHTSSKKRLHEEEDDDDDEYGL